MSHQLLPLRVYMEFKTMLQLMAINLTTVLGMRESMVVCCVSGTIKYIKIATEGRNISKQMETFFLVGIIHLLQQNSKQFKYFLV